MSVCVYSLWRTHHLGDAFYTTVDLLLESLLVGDCSAWVPLGRNSRGHFGTLLVKSLKKRI
jgi:hypothetical protein